MNHTHLWSCC